MSSAVQMNPSTPSTPSTPTSPATAAAALNPSNSLAPLNDQATAFAATAALPLAPLNVQPLAADQCAEWDAFVQQQPGASLYHLSGWRGVCTEAFGHDCPYLAAWRGGRIVAVLPLVRLQSRLFGHFMVSVPFFNYGGLLGNDAEARGALLAQAVALAQAKGCSHIELRERQPLPGWPSRTDKISMLLALPDSAEQLWKKLGSKMRAQIKKAQSHELQFQHGGAELLDDFYAVFCTNMRDLGTPVYGKDFFATILRQAPGQPRLFIGRTKEGQAVSASLVVQHNGTMEVPWASTLRSANALSANMELYWQMLSYACNQGCKAFDFGRSSRESATYRFKKQWGAEPVELHWNYWLQGGGELPRLSPDNPKYRLAISAWQRMPLWATKLIGPRLVKYLP